MNFNCSRSLYRLGRCSFSTSKLVNSQAYFMGKGICVLLWNVLKVSYTGVSMRRLEQICDIKACVFLLCHHEVSSDTVVVLVEEGGRSMWRGKSRTTAFAVNVKFACGLILNSSQSCCGFFYFYFASCKIMQLWAALVTFFLTLPSQKADFLFKIIQCQVCLYKHLTLKDKHWEHYTSLL